MHPLVSANPGKATMAKLRKVRNQQFQCLFFIRHHRVAETRIAHRDGNDVLLRGFDGLEKLWLHLTENRQSEKLVMPHSLLHRTRAEVVLRAEENGVVAILDQSRVQTVLGVAEEIALRVQPQPRAQDEAHAPARDV